MKKLTAFRTFMAFLSCLFSALSFLSWGSIAAEAAVPSSQQQPVNCEAGESVTDINPGTIANPAGVELGTVKDFVLDLEAGRIAYAVGVFDQIGALSNRVFVIPWGVVKVALEVNTFTMNEGKPALKSAPSFALDTWSNLPTSQWSGIVATYWQEKLGDNFAAAHTSASALSKASDLVGVIIKDSTGQDVGTIEELMLDPEMGSIAYAVVSFQDPTRNNQTVFFALPWDRVQVNPIQHTFVADVDKKMLTDNRHVSRDRFENNASSALLNRGTTQTTWH